MLMTPVTRDGAPFRISGLHPDRPAVQRHRSTTKSHRASLLADTRRPCRPPRYRTGKQPHEAPGPHPASARTHAGQGRLPSSRSRGAEGSPQLCAMRERVEACAHVHNRPWRAAEEWCWLTFRAGTADGRRSRDRERLWGTPFSVTPGSVGSTAWQADGGRVVRPPVPLPAESLLQRVFSGRIDDLPSVRAVAPRCRSPTAGP